MQCHNHANKRFFCCIAGPQAKVPGAARAALLARSRIPRHVPKQQAQLLPRQLQARLPPPESGHMASVVSQADALHVQAAAQHIPPIPAGWQQQQQQQQLSQQQVQVPMCPPSHAGVPYGVAVVRPSGRKMVGQSSGVLMGSPEAHPQSFSTLQPPSAAEGSRTQLAVLQPYMQPCRQPMLSSGMANQAPQQHVQPHVLTGYSSWADAHRESWYGQSSGPAMYEPQCEQLPNQQMWHQSIVGHGHGPHRQTPASPAATAAASPAAGSPWVQHAWYPALPGGYQPPLAGLAMPPGLMQQQPVRSVPSLAQPGADQVFMHQHSQVQPGCSTWKGHHDNTLAEAACRQPRVSQLGSLSCHPCLVQTQSSRQQQHDGTTTALTAESSASSAPLCNRRGVIKAYNLNALMS